MSNYRTDRKPLITDAPIKISTFGNRRFARHNKQPPIGPWYVWKCDKGWEKYFQLSLKEVSSSEGVLFITIYSRQYEWANATWRVQLIKEECNYGGGRWWFICPITGKKCVNIYFYDTIGSREGLWLKYPSQLESQKHRAYKHFFDMAYPEDNPNPIKYPYRNWKPTRRQKGRLRRLYWMQSKLSILGV